ncbi:MAG: hypothetical protein GQ552_03160 [Flavobacteriaceae bacterium]|nr:hypothetical protein [Flavobacteriaceae bacterium]
MANHKQSTFDNEDSKALFKVGMKYLAISLPLLFISPILITIGFKALKKSDNYIVLILGCFLAFFTIFLVVQAFRKILKSLFSR